MALSETSSAIAATGRLFGVDMMTASHAERSRLFRSAETVMRSLVKRGLVTNRTPAAGWVLSDTGRQTAEDLRWQSEPATSQSSGSPATRACKSSRAAGTP